MQSWLLVCWSAKFNMPLIDCSLFSETTKSNSVALSLSRLDSNTVFVEYCWGICNPSILLEMSSFYLIWARPSQSCILPPLRIDFTKLFCCIMSLARLRVMINRPPQECHIKLITKERVHATQCLLYEHPWKKVLKVLSVRRGWTSPEQLLLRILELMILLSNSN